MRLVVLNLNIDRIFETSSFSHIQILILMMFNDHEEIKSGFSTLIFFLSTKHDLDAKHYNEDINVKYVLNLVGVEGKSMMVWSS